MKGVTSSLLHCHFRLRSSIVSSLSFSSGSAQTPLQCLSLTLIVIFPTFSTVLSSPALAALTPLKRMRIVTAGAWHNLFVWILFSLVGRAFFNTPIKGGSPAGSWRDISKWGRVVLSVDEVRSYPLPAQSRDIQFTARRIHPCTRTCLTGR
jgi:hypothetical protein